MSASWGNECYPIAYVTSGVCSTSNAVLTSQVARLSNQ
jgi:hypothetical protein